MIARGTRLALIGPLPPPSGGMANQTRQLANLLGQEDIEVEIVQVNAPYRPQWVGEVWGLRALFRLVPYLWRLWRAAGRVQLFHVMANSGWAWHLFAAPAVWIAKLRRIPVVVNYRGGEAETFFAKAIRQVRPTMRTADRVIVPSAFLEQVFKRFGLNAEVVPNIIDLARFAPDSANQLARRDSPLLIVTRNLEAIYDIATAIRAFAIVCKTWPAARLSIAGSGPELAKLQDLTQIFDLKGKIEFTGRLDNEHMGALYRQADVFINTSVVDNMPNSILESLASGVPVVTTNVGGIPFLVEHERTALLVPPGDPDAVAAAVLALLADHDKARRLSAAGREYVQRYSWSSVRGRLFEVYASLIDKAPGGSVGLAK